MSSTQVVQPAASATPHPSELYVGLVSEPTFGVVRPVTLRVFKAGLVFEDAADITEVKRDAIQQVDLLDWWEDWRRIQLTYRDADGARQTRTFVVTRPLGPDAKGTNDLYALLRREYGPKVREPVHERPAAAPKRRRSPVPFICLGILVVYSFVAGLFGLFWAIFICVIVGRAAQPPWTRRVAAITAGITIAGLVGAYATSIWLSPMLLTIEEARQVVASTAGRVRADDLAALSRLPGGERLVALVRTSENAFDVPDRLSAIAQRRAQIIGQIEYPSAEEAQPAIQEMVNAMQDALWRGDKTAFMSYVDKANPSWKTVQEDWFDEMKGQGGPEDVKVSVDVLETEYLWKGFYRSRVKITIDHSRYRDGVEYGWWLFRYVDGKWLHSEPDERELGNRLARDTEHLTIVYWEWDRPQLDSYAAWGEAAYAHVVEKLGAAPDKKVRIVFRPIFRNYRADHGLGEQGFFASHIPDEIFVRSPQSFGGDKPREGQTLDDAVIATLAHELTHLVHNNKLGLTNRTPLWMAEGLAEHVSGNYRLDLLRYAQREKKLFSIQQLDRPQREWFKDEPWRFGLLYGEGAMVVRYIDERWGLEKFIELAKRRSSGANLNTATQDVLEIAADHLDADFQSWLRSQLSD